MISREGVGLDFVLIEKVLNPPLVGVHLSDRSHKAIRAEELDDSPFSDSVSPSPVNSQVKAREWYNSFDC